jgi:hypothetical protein
MAEEADVWQFDIDVCVNKVSGKLFHASVGPYDVRTNRKSGYWVVERFIWCISSANHRFSDNLSAVLRTDNQGYIAVGYL